MKITFLINSLSNGGAEKVLSTLISTLINQNYDVEVIFLEKNEFYKLPSKVKKTYLSNFDGKQNNFFKFIFLPILAYKLTRYVKKQNIKSIQSHVFRANYVNTLSKYFGSKHIVQVVTAGRISRYLEQGILGKINLFLVKYLYKKADLIISKAQAMENDMQKLFNFINKKIIINNPYDIELIKNLSLEIVSEFNFNSEKKYLVSVGRLIKLKRNIDLIKALMDLPKNFEIIFIGKGEEEKQLIEFAKNSDLLARIHFIGQVENPYKFLSKCNYFINCSESEGFPNVLVEAMICGIPVISSDCISGPREILAPDTDSSIQIQEDFEITEYGILFPIGNVQSIVKAITFFENNLNIKNRLITKSFQRIKEYSLENIINKYKKVLEIE